MIQGNTHGYSRHLERTQPPTTSPTCIFPITPRTHTCMRIFCQSTPSADAVSGANMGFLHRPVLHVVGGRTRLSVNATRWLSPHLLQIYSTEVIRERMGVWRTTVPVTDTSLPVGCGCVFTNVRLLTTPQCTLQVGSTTGRILVIQTATPPLCCSVQYTYQQGWPCTIV